MTYSTTQCSTCELALSRENRRIHEAKKYNWKTYCSRECLIQARNTKRHTYCANPLCAKAIKRTLKEIRFQKQHFCSSSCAAKINNRHRILLKPISRKTHYPKKYCANVHCKIIILKRNTYCSVKCRRSLDKVTKEAYAKRALEGIQTFFKKTGRIPFKKELWSIYKPARIAFGTWNNAIIAAGFNPNPVMFANKCLAKDGHSCDSMAERIIDDWLYERGISHDRGIPYGKNKMTADFRVGEVLIEFFGLCGQHDGYDKLVKEKQKLWQQQNLQVIALYPKDILPRSKLEQSLSTVL